MSSKKKGVTKVIAHHLENGERIEFLVPLVKGQIDGLAHETQNDRIIIYCDNDESCLMVEHSLKPLNIDMVTFTTSICQDEDRRLEQWSMFTQCKVIIAIMSMNCMEKVSLPLAKHTNFLGSKSEPNFLCSLIDIMHQKTHIYQDIFIDAIVSKEASLSFLTDLQREVKLYDRESPKWLDDIISEKNQRRARGEEVSSNPPSDDDDDDDDPKNEKVTSVDQIKIKKGVFFIPKHLLHLPSADGDSSDEDYTTPADYDSEPEPYWQYNS